MIDASEFCYSGLLRTAILIDAYYLSLSRNSPCSNSDLPVNRLHAHLMLYIWLSFEPSDEGHEKCLSNIMYVFRHQLSDDFSAVATFFKEAVVSAGVVQ